MTHDIETLTDILLWVLYVTAACATAFPLLYLFCPWWTTAIGRILMLHGFALAFALDMTAVFHFWNPPILVAFWTQIVIFSLIGMASILMTVWLWRINFLRKE